MRIALLPKRHSALLGPCLLLVLCLLPATTARGQETSDPDPVLPDIAPREIEIRGQLEVSFPSLRRQPLIGFNPPPRIPLIPADRRPYVAPYKQDSADLPPSPLGRPVPPPVNTARGLEPQRGEVEISAGRYLSRTVIGRTGVPLSATESAFGSLVYRGSNGAEPDPTYPEASSSYDSFVGEVGLQTRRGWIAAGGSLHGFRDEYQLYGLRDLDREEQTFPLRTGRHLGADAWLRTRGEAPVMADVRLTYGSTRYRADVFTPEDRLPDGATIEDLNERRERRLTLDADLAVPLGRQQLWTTVDASTAGLDEPGLLGSTLASLDLGAGARFRAGRGFDVRLGAQGMAFSAPHPEEDARLRKTYLSPAVHIRTYPVPGLLLYAQNTPGLSLNTLEDLFGHNPYLVTEPDQQPTARLIDAEAGLNLFIGPVQINGQAGFIRSPNWLYFEEPVSAAEAPVTYGLTVTRYGEADILHAGGGLSLVLPAGLQASVSSSFRHGRLTGPDTHIPYFSPIVGDFMLAYVFAQRRARLQMTATYERARYWTTDTSRRIGDFFDLDVIGTYDFTDRFGAILRVENISADRLEYWDRYPRDPLVIGAGIRLFW
ncbi:MAG: hypothetical protein D6685_16685 [Bacteroidetes bacterium]|nr:MAG: hypothetical protein D6685_16685 [Bacteroidota bacterium]